MDAERLVVCVCGGVGVEEVFQILVYAIGIMTSGKWEEVPF
jgi:hypothetical protein